ncbi:PepSY domain-containing protein [Streptomyces sp. CWNU-52B]|uniref:PepSY domain-containing protein n=1 Tax=unclassified Streptomyces TaxID=2593676 RepID=UPI0039BF3DAD
MKRVSLVLLTSGALVAAVAGTALAGGSDDTSPARGTSSATASAAPSPGVPTASADDTAGPAATASGSTSVSGRRAGELALARVGGGTISRIEAEQEHGRAVWNVRIVKSGDRYDVHVDRSSGEITRSRAKDGDGRGDDTSGGRQSLSGSDDHGRHHDDDGGGDDRHRGGDDEDGGRHGRHHG